MREKLKELLNRVNVFLLHVVNSDEITNEETIKTAEELYEEIDTILDDDKNSD